MYLRSLAGTLALLALVSAPQAFAQSGFYVVPWIAVEEVYDDNIFFDPDNEVSDFITRVSPQLDVGFESETLAWLLSYRNDAEWYRDLSDLDSTTARGFGLAQIEYDLDRRWTLRGQSEYIQTNTAQDLSLNPGGGEIPGRVGRAEAERFLLGGGASYRFSQRVAGDLEVSWVDDELIDFSKNETLSVNSQIEQLLTPARLLLYGYRYRGYEFESEQVGIDPVEVVTESEDSNTLWVGLRQEFSERSDVEVRAGPRISDGEVEPYLIVRWRRDYSRGSTTIDASWDETTFLGTIGRQESRSIAATWTHRFSEKFEFNGSAGYAYLTGGGIDTYIGSIDVAGIYEFTPSIFLTARYAFNVQGQDPPGLQGDRLTHNIASLAITFTRPRRVSERSPN